MIDHCYICNSVDHVFCGFCDRCHDHAMFVRSLDSDEDQTPLSECCGAVGSAYDEGDEDYPESYAMGDVR